MTENEYVFKLVKDYLAGDESAFNMIVNKYKDKIYWHARRMTGNHLDADEIVQEVLLVLYKKLKDFQFKSSLYTWIYRITSTRTINHLKKKKIKQIFSIDEAANKLSHSDDIVKNFEDKEKLQRVEKALQKIPTKQREVFLFRVYEGLSYEEISQITGKSIGGLKANYFHAANKIMELMKDDEK